ncbi:MAG: J domain-containing protein [Oliverpabstia sp.]|nr:J domain-containing protein [Oliverpabstia sp.]
MDQLIAYEILGLQPGASRESIKKAYAELSKKYHPEDYPREFQQLNEAYRILTRGRREGRYSENTEPVYTNAPERQPDHQETQKKYDFRSVKEEEQEGQQEEQKAYDFEGVLEEEAEREQEKLHELTIKALYEMQILLRPEYCEKSKLFQSFFQNQEYQDVVETPEFLQEFSRMLRETSLKKSIYKYIINVYRLRGKDPKTLTPQEAALYHVLDEKCGMKSHNKGIWYVGIPAGIVAGLRSGLKSAGRFSVVATVLLVSFVIIFMLVKLYRKLYENHSNIFSQSVIAGIILVTQVIVLFTDLYGILTGNTDGGVLVAVFLFFGSGIWLLVLGIAGIMKKIKQRYRK